jgi:Phage integrase family
LKTAQWEIPGDRTKTRKPHLVPLSPQAMSLLKGLYELTGKAPENLAFPSLRRGRPLSENTLGVALKTLGYDGNTHAAHGFRSSASTLLHELGFSPEVIETQLAHVRPGVGGIYNRSHLVGPAEEDDEVLGEVPRPVEARIVTATRGCRSTAAAAHSSSHAARACAQRSLRGLFRVPRPFVGPVIVSSAARIGVSSTVPHGGVSRRPLVSSSSASAWALSHARLSRSFPGISTSRTWPVESMT